MAFNQLTNAQAEVLTILAEECAEVIVIVGKILRHGLESRDPTDPDDDSPNNREMLSSELGDVRAAVQLCRKYDCVAGNQYITIKAQTKMIRIAKYLHHASTEGLEM